jgi:hypothetical protein
MFTDSMRWITLGEKSWQSTQEVRVKFTRILVAPAVAALAAAAIATSAGAASASEASAIVPYTGGAYSGNSVELNACGVSNIPPGYHGSYKWYGTGQSALLYNTPNAQGVPVFSFSAARGEVDDPDGFGWQSIFIVC